MTHITRLYAINNTHTTRRQAHIYSAASSLHYYSLFQRLYKIIYYIYYACPWHTGKIYLTVEPYDVILCDSNRWYEWIRIVIAKMTLLGHCEKKIVCI